MLHQDVAPVNKADSFCLCVAITLPHVAESRRVQWDCCCLLQLPVRKESSFLTSCFLFFFFFALFSAFTCHTSLSCVWRFLLLKMSHPASSYLSWDDSLFLFGDALKWMSSDKCILPQQPNISLHAVFFFSLSRHVMKFQSFPQESGALTSWEIWCTSIFCEVLLHYTMHWTILSMHACKHSHFSFILTFIHFIGICVHLMWFCSFPLQIANTEVCTNRLLQ